MNTKRYLHSSSEYPAPLSRYNYEVSGYSEDGKGGTSDNWKVECMHRKAGIDEQLWESDTLVRFVHVNTKRFLTSSVKAKYDPTNCPRCPIHGELEVSATSRNSDATTRGSIFHAGDGAYLS